MTANAANAPHTMTASVINAFVEKIDLEKEYDIKTLKEILTDTFKAKKAETKQADARMADAKKKTKGKKEENKEPIIIATPPLPVDSPNDSDNDKPKKRGRPANGPKLDKNGNEKAKREPSAYNKFVKQRISELKADKPDTAAKDLMLMAATEWKSLTKAEQEKYK